VPAQSGHVFISVNVTAPGRCPYIAALRAVTHDNDAPTHVGHRSGGAAGAGGAAILDILDSSEYFATMASYADPNVFDLAIITVLIYTEIVRTPTALFPCRQQLFFGRLNRHDGEAEQLYPSMKARMIPSSCRGRAHAFGERLTVERFR